MHNLEELREVIDPYMVDLVLAKLPQGETGDYYKGVLYAMYSFAGICLASDIDSIVLAQTVGAYILVLEDKLKGDESND